jgi:anaerobic ribonucleoside-triphosphate reductase activating protein
MILKVKGIEGVTFTGGEPTLQAGGLVELSRILRSEGLSIVCYSGYPYQQLLEKEDLDIAALLSSLDILIDGPYLEQESARLLWRGSRNQKVHFLSDRYQDWEDRAVLSTQQVELIIGDNNWAMTGIWQELLHQKLQQYFSSTGEDRNE